VDLEQVPLSLVSITEELLEWKSSGSGSRKPTTQEPLSAKVGTCGGRSVGIVCLCTKTTEFLYGHQLDEFAYTLASN
jgi:hypothetical protein